MNQIKIILKNQGRSQRWLASKVDKSYSTVTRYCNNITQPEEQTLKKIAISLDKEISELIASDPGTEGNEAPLPPVSD
jgi:putative transcriptional regulator